MPPKPDMIAIFAAHPGGPEVLTPRRVARPKPGNGELLIRVHAAGINRPDLRQRTGHLPPPTGITEVLGLEVSGVVAAVGAGGNCRFSIGDEVCALVAGGGYAEYCVAPIQQVLPKPACLSHVEAAALPETFFTVWSNVFKIGRLSKGESILIHGGASGIGTTAIQLASAFGARTIIVTASTEVKANACLELGANFAINYKTDDFPARVKEITKDEGVDLVLDIVCAPYLEANLTSLGTGGRLIIIAFQGGGQADGIDLESVVRKRQMISGSTLRPQSLELKGEIARDLLENVWPKINGGSIKPVIQSVYSLENAASGHAELEAGQHIGKIMLAVEGRG